MLRRLAGGLLLLTVLGTAPAVLAWAAAAPVSPTAATAVSPTAAAGDAAASSASSPSDPDWDDRASKHRRHRETDHADSVVSIGHDSTLKEGNRADSVVSIFGSSTANGEAGDVVSILGDTRVTGGVSDSTVAVLGNVSVDSKVDGDVVAVLGNVDLGPNAEVGGSVVAIGGTLSRDPAAIVHGDSENVFPGTLYGFDGLRAWTRHCLVYGRPLALAAGVGWAWGVALAILVLYMLMAVLFREGLFRSVSTFETHPGHCLLAALIAVLATPVLVVLLCATVIGIAAIPFLVIGLICAGLFGRAAMLAWIGRRIVGGRDSRLGGNPALLVLIGGAVVLLLYLVPVIGFLVFQLLGFLGLGTVLYAAILSFRARETARAPGSAGGAPAAGPTPPPPPPQPPPTPPPAPYSATPPSAPAAPAPSAASAPPAPPPPTPPSGPAAAASAPFAAGPAAPAASISAPPTDLGAALPRAGFARRMGALLIDVVLVGFVLEILHRHTHMELMVLAAYGAVMWKMRGSTVGGLVLDLKVVRVDGRELDWPTAIVRALGCFLSLAIVGLGFFWIAFDPESQAWHDKIAGTLVLKVDKARPLV